MDRITTLFEALPIPEIARLMRRTVLSGLVTGVVALGVSLAVGYPLVGLGVCAGLGLGLANLRLITWAVARVNRSGVSRARRALVSGTLLRLGATTVIVIGLALASVDLGIGAAGGIAVFYFLLLGSLVRTLLQQKTKVAL